MGLRSLPCAILVRMSESDVRAYLETLSDEQRQRIAVMGELRRGWAAWQSARLVAIGSARQLVEDGALAVSEVCAAFEVSQATWYRYLAELNARLEGRGGPASEAAGEQAEAGARDALAVLRANRESGQETEN